MIRVAPAALSAIRDHGRETYPEECCGALIGPPGGEAPQVTRIEKIENARREERHRRYTIEPLEYARVEKIADGEGAAILGFYHSHPDHPAVPSEYDRERALPLFHYVVLAVGAGSPGDVGSFVLSEDRGVFEREELLVADPQE